MLWKRNPFVHATPVWTLHSWDESFTPETFYCISIHCLFYCAVFYYTASGFRLIHCVPWNSPSRPRGPSDYDVAFFLQQLIWSLYWHPKNTVLYLLMSVQMCGLISAVSLPWLLLCEISRAPYLTDGPAVVATLRTSTWTATSRPSPMWRTAAAASGASGSTTSPSQTPTGSAR